MRPYLDSVLNVTLDRSPQEWIVGIVIALFLALALAGVNMAFRRWVKAKDDTVPLVGLGVVAIFAGMVIAGMYFEVNRRVAAGPPSAGGGPAGPGGGPGGPGGPGGGGRGGGGGGRFTTRMATLIFENADADHDGLLTIDEAANAAAKFVHDSDASGKDKLDREAPDHGSATADGAARRKYSGAGWPCPGGRRSTAGRPAGSPTAVVGSKSAYTAVDGMIDAREGSNPPAAPLRECANRSGQALGFLLRFGLHVAEVPFRTCTPPASSEGEPWFWIAQA